MNDAGYKIIHIGDGTENGFRPIVIVKANPVIENEEEFQEFNEAKSQEGMIAIETTFEPTLELTNEINSHKRVC